MEFKLINGLIEFSCSSFHTSKKRKVISVNQTCNSQFRLDLIPVIDEGSTADYAEVDAKRFHEHSIDLLFGDSASANRLKTGSNVCVTTHLTMNSSSTATLMITKSRTSEGNGVDMFEDLLKFQENLAPKSIEINLSVDSFQKDSRRFDIDEKGLRFSGKGLKLKRDEGGSACFELTDIQITEEIWRKEWNPRSNVCLGWLSLNVRLYIVAVTELYKMHFGRDPLTTTELGTAHDVVILVGGNKDKEKGIKCHKAIFSEMSPVFAAMFQTEMLEAKEGVLEIVDFSEAVIRVLIEFGYRRNLEEAWESGEMTVELLELADKYQMKELTNMLLYIIWCMPFSWFSADVAVKLFFYAKNAGKDLAEAEKKAWKTLKWYAKNYPEKLMESKEIENLRENPRAMKEFVVLLLNKCKN